MKFRNKKIAVLYGGMSSEREISLKSGEAVCQALVGLGYQVEKIDVGMDVATQLRSANIDVAYLALHGKWGEDGAIQGLLEILKIPYTGSGVMASALAMDKYLTKELVKYHGVHCPQHVLYEHGKQDLPTFLKNLSMQFPIVVKPVAQGSTIGIEKIMDPASLAEALARAVKFDTRVLLEEMIVGTEVTVAVLDGVVLPIIEVVPKAGFYDFTSKYTKGMTEYLIPARISAIVAEQLAEQTKKTFQLLALAGVARADFMVRDDQTYFLEVNTLPGMTETSLVPKAAKALGIEFPQLVEKILNTAELKIL